MIKTIIKKAKSWSSLRLSRKSKTDRLIPPIPLFEPPQIIVSDPQGQPIDDLDVDYKGTHPFHWLNRQELEQTPLSNIFPNLFYKEK